jgi:predicted enzyme related to lactoylglutathione lyase
MDQADQNRRIDYVEFPATDIDATKQFYTDVFGWEFRDFGSEYTSFSDGRMRGGFQNSPKVGVGGALIVLYSDDLAKTEARVASSGGQIVKKTFEFPGGRRFHFSDPSGNVLAVWSDR